MAPDADRLRQRHTKVVAEKDDTSATEPVLRISTLKTVGETEVVIDGGIYDIKDFNHPGGESILLFGGNDVTVQYKMIHPYHTKKHLEKMKRVGTVPDYSSEYVWDTPFEREIKKEVFKIVNRGKEFGTWGYFARAVFYISLFFFLQYYWVTTPTTFALAIVYGISQGFIGLNVQHDANHGAASKKPWVNDLLGLGADFIGGSKWLWMEQHWTHHSYTNHHENDPDSYGAEPMLLWNDYPPGHEKRGFLHRFQAFYYLFVLAGYWFSSVFNKQILDLKQSGAATVGINMENPYIRKSRKYAIGLRLLYIFTNVVMPFVTVGGLSWSVFGHIMTMGAASSLTLAILFALSHNFEEVDRDPTFDTRHGGEGTCWFKSQVETSSTYGGFISGCLTGGLNFQVEHHLFPRMSSAWYPFIAPKVREICKKHGVKYAYYPWVHQNLISTIKYIHAAGNGSNWAHGNPYSGTQ
uniref:Cytochrome b5 heme-binding domain-containing protein n=1 Tax=Pseudo-nitzschia australis TaxID=44445 RepID=A0A7S4AER6_9STRA|mmetsp:Transcript_24392/g.53410  ORF Transcript_24392/g.53410 Transcript_24392/m.53410 type:complete len:466 (+) Transcript_24392:264-1661(+)